MDFIHTWFVVAVGGAGIFMIMLGIAMAVDSAYQQYQRWCRRRGR